MKFPLVGALEAEGLAVWYDEGSLRIGANLRRTIDAGLIRSRFGVVVLSPAFFGHGWRQYELDGLVAQEQADGRQRCRRRVGCMGGPNHSGTASVALARSRRPTRRGEGCPMGYDGQSVDAAG